MRIATHELQAQSCQPDAYTQHNVVGLSSALAIWLVAVDHQTSQTVV